MKAEKPLVVLVAFALLTAGAAPSAANVSIRQYYQAPTPSPYPSIHGGPNPYQRAPPQVQETWPQLIRPRGSPRIRMSPNELALRMAMGARRAGALA